MLKLALALVSHLVVGGLAGFILGMIWGPLRNYPKDFHDHEKTWAEAGAVIGLMVFIIRAITQTLNLN